MKYVRSIRQESLVRSQYKYIIDACSIISQNPRGSYPRDVHVGLWKEIEALVDRRQIVTCRQIVREVSFGKRGDLAKKWIDDSKIEILVEDEFVQNRVVEVVNGSPGLLHFKTTRKTSSGDAFLIATAMDYGLTIITEEKPTSPIKIPQVARRFGVDSISISELAQKEGWTFG